VRVLVTGGAGYIGSVITDQLLEAGHGVVVLDNLSKGHREAVAHGATLIEGDLLDLACVVDVLARERIAAVVHMAASSLVGESMTAPERYYRNNVIASLSLLEAMNESGVKMMVLSSTAAIYGEPQKQPITETDPAAPSNPYGETKLAVERAMFWHGRAHGLRYGALRYFNAAGATATRGERHDPETHLIPLVLKAVMPRAPRITVFGNDYPTRDGTCVRDYVHVSDLARAHVIALEALESGELCQSIFNLGSGTGYTVREVLEVARRVTGKAVPMEVGPRRDGDPAVLVASAQHIRDVLGWMPEHSTLEEIVDSAWRWMCDHPC
jgi:UDP-glucose 4-epimerase